MNMYKKKYYIAILSIIYVFIQSYLMIKMLLGTYLIAQSQSQVIILLVPFSVFLISVDVILVFVGRRVVPYWIVLSIVTMFLLLPAFIGQGYYSFIANAFILAGKFSILGQLHDGIKKNI